MTVLSFILPVYNVEQYLKECFESIYNQMGAECEIILVDDGSKDKSGYICDKLKLRGENIKVIHKENGGLASARNAGLNASRGDYIAFVDSDDRISPDSIKQVLNLVKSNAIDICFMKGVKFFPDGKKEDLGDQIESEQLLGKDKNEVLKYLASRPKYPGSSCTKIYRRQFLRENGLEFPHDRRQSEDLGFVRDCIMEANQYCALDCQYYEYRQNRVGSITHGATLKAINGIMQFVEETVDKYSLESNGNVAFQNAAYSFAAYEYFVALLNYSLLKTNEEKRAAYIKMNQYKWISKYSQSPTHKQIGLMLQFLGVRLTGFLISKLYAIRRN